MVTNVPSSPIAISADRNKVSCRFLLMYLVHLMCLTVSAWLVYNFLYSLIVLFLWDKQISFFSPSGRLLCRWSWVTCMPSDCAFWPAPALFHWVAWSSFLSHLLWAFSHVYLYHFSPLMRIGWAHWCFWGLGARCPHASQWSLLAAVIGLFLPRVLSPLKVTYFRPSVPFSLTVFVCLSMSLFLFLFHHWPLMLE